MEIIDKFIETYIGLSIYYLTFTVPFFVIFWYWLAPSTHHNLHHTKFTGNYGLYFRWWDKLMNTEFSNFEEAYQSLFKRSFNKAN